MGKITKKSIGLTVAALMSLTTLSGIATSSNQINIVQAASKSLTDANAHLTHLNWSLHNNYLGLKNQGQWQAYISEIRSLVKSIPSSEKAEAQKITESLDKADALVRALSRINQVEKSMDVNAKIIRNVKQWGIYLDLSDRDLARVDTNEFSKELAELKDRKNACEDISNNIQVEYNQKAKVVEDLLDTASQSNKQEDAKKAYDSALTLPSCDNTEFYIYSSKMLLAKTGAVKLSADEIAINEALKKFDAIGESNLIIDDSNASTLEAALKAYIGNGINVKASKLGEDTVSGYVIFEVSFSKGEVKGYTNTLTFE